MKARGERVAQAKLTARQVRDIRRCGGSNQATAKRFGVGKEAVRRVRNWTTWIHVREK